MFKKILVASDLTDGSLPALRTAFDLARHTGATLVALHVCEPHFENRALFAQLVPGERELIARIGEREREGAESVLLGQVKSLGPDLHDGERIETLVLAGVAFEVIAETARNVEADVIVMGTHGRRGFKHAIMGSVAERVVRTATVPVLTVRG